MNKTLGKPLASLDRSISRVLIISLPLSFSNLFNHWELDCVRNLNLWLSVIICGHIVCDLKCKCDNVIWMVTHFRTPSIPLHITQDKAKVHVVVQDRPVHCTCTNIAFLLLLNVLCLKRSCIFQCDLTVRFFRMENFEEISTGLKKKWNVYQDFTYLHTYTYIRVCVCV